MIGVCIAIVVLGSILTCAGLVIGGIAALEEQIAATLAAALVSAAGIALVVFGIAEGYAIERAECEEAGYEWITGECYGSNVRVIE